MLTLQLLPCSQNHLKQLGIRGQRGQSRDHLWHVPLGRCQQLGQGVEVWNWFNSINCSSSWASWSSCLVGVGSEALRQLAQAVVRN
jgi:hypothetical protein